MDYSLGGSWDFYIEFRFSNRCFACGMLQKLKGSYYGFKHENIYYFKDGQLLEL